jgi:soluble lytic murein transglycosylase-like protein
MKSWLYLIGLNLAGLTLACLILTAAPAWAGEFVVLQNGFRLHADRHEIAGETVRIYSGGGITEMPAASVNGFEAEPPTPEPPSLSVPAPAAPESKPTAAATEPKNLAVNAARKFDLPESFVQSVMRAESGFHADALSPKGAIGLMQLMPDTARDLGVDPKNPQENSEGGAAYLRQLLALYENRPDQVLLALAAYNAGPAAVERWHGVPPYRETREYILRVLKGWDAKSGK